MMKTALVTGAGSGIGKAVALILARNGYAVVLAGRRGQLLEDTARGAPDGATLVVPADVSDANSVRDLFRQTEERFGRLDLLFNNAGTNTPSEALDELDPKVVTDVIDINVTGSLLCAQQAFALMKRQSPRGGRIINNGSVSAYGPRPHSSAYTTAKHAITGLTKSLILDGREHDIPCGQIDIGNAATERTARMERGVLQANGVLATEPRIDVDHIARAVLHMAELPLDVNIPFLTIMPTRMPLYGRG